MEVSGVARQDGGPPFWVAPEGLEGEGVRSRICKRDDWAAVPSEAEILGRRCSSSTGWRCWLCGC